MANKYKFESWNVAFRKHNNDIAQNQLPFASIPNPVMFWAADPFIVHKENKYYIFAELYNRLLYKGKIKYCILDENGKVIQKWRTALKSKGHLSFPYIYQGADGELKMMPESSQENRLSVYVSEHFPNKWTLKEDILTGVQVADSVYLSKDTILTYDNISRPRMLLKYSSVSGGWKLVQTVDDPEISLRPGGAPFEIDGKRYLPIQESEGGEYGKKLKIVQINGDDISLIANDVKYLFTPETISVEGETADIEGIHTYNFDGEFEVIDYKTYSSNVLSMMGYALRKIRRMAKSWK